MDKIIDITAGCLIFVIAAILTALNGRKRRLNSRYFQKRWKVLQKLCSDKKTWYQAVLDADDLLDEALQKAHFKGKSTGERLVSAQRYFTANDAVWFGHKLKNKIAEQNFKRLSKHDTLEALAGFHKALKDIGAIKSKSGDASE